MFVNPWEKKRAVSQAEQMRTSPDRLKALMRLLPLSKATRPFQKGDGLACPGAWRHACLSILMTLFIAV